MLSVPQQAEILVSFQFGQGSAPLWFTGRSSKPAGAAFYNALAVDSLDCHDGFRPAKGHAGATVVPVALAVCDGLFMGGQELLAALVVGYELACRAGLALHATSAPHYHASGAWAGIGAAAAGARLMNVPADSLDGVLGAAEYFAPIAPMMRCIAHPSAVKDGAAAGALSATMALAMQTHGLPGLPSLFEAEPFGREQARALGEDWMILRQYFKLYPTCRWTQPVVEGALLLLRQGGFAWDQIERLDVETFDCAAALTAFPPLHSDAAQYSIPWAVAAMLVDGCLGVAQIQPGRLTDPAILSLGRRVTTHVAQDLQARFPAECLARVAITLKDGRRIESPTMRAQGDWDASLTEAPFADKFHQIAAPALGEDLAAELREVVETLDDRPASDLLSLQRCVPSVERKKAS